MAGDNLDQNLGVVDKIAALAEARQCTPAQLALAWLVHHSPIVVPIPGPRKQSRLEVAALEIELSYDDLAELDRIAPAGVAAGTRYPEPAMRGLNR